MSAREINYATHGELLNAENFYRHTHEVSHGDLTHVLHGNGRHVMRVIHPQRRVPHGLAFIVGDDGRNEWGESFVYGDYFLPEELRAS